MTQTRTGTSKYERVDFRYDDLPTNPPGCPIHHVYTIRRQFKFQPCRSIHCFSSDILITFDLCGSDSDLTESFTTAQNRAYLGRPRERDCVVQRYVSNWMVHIALSVAHLSTGPIFNMDDSYWLIFQEFQRGAIHGGSRGAHYPLTGWD